MIVRCRVCHRVQPLDGFKTCPGCLERNAVRLRRHRERRKDREHQAVVAQVGARS